MTRLTSEHVPPQGDPDHPVLQVLQEELLTGTFPTQVPPEIRDLLALTVQEVGENPSKGWRPSLPEPLPGPEGRRAGEWQS